jgi:geranylgeranyl pyrophosphate synthase
MALVSLTVIIEKRLDELVANRSLPQKTLYEAARYSLLSTGKRLRPILTLASAETFGASSEIALDCACAIEMIHTYSLIHDDLPCMDDDALRRGIPTLHKVYSEGHAVLTGDFLLTFAFEVIANAPLLTAEQKLDLIKTLSIAAGGEGMIGGQVIDLSSEGKKIDWPLLEYMHISKTAALITAAVESGAIIGTASLEERASLKLFAQKLGLAFQILDDILDEESDAKEKTTAVSLLGKQEAQRLLETLSQSALVALSLLPRDTSQLRELTHWIIPPHSR